jgi:CRP-like cAMP-binding protein
MLKLKHRDRLSAEEQAVIGRLCNASKTFGAGEALVREGDRPGHSSIVESGWAGRVKFVGEGARTISALHLAGDFIDLHSFLLKPMDHAVIALTECRISLVPHDRLKSATETYPHLARLLWLDTLVDAAIHRAWIACLGGRSAVQRLAHLLCELLMRTQAVELADDDLGYDLPLTQSVLADTLGMTTTHLNRSLQELRAKDLIRFGSGHLRILNWDRLRELADFDPAYLNMTCEPR